jgi:uncharacterized protein YcfJ
MRTTFQQATAIAAVLTAAFAAQAAGAAQNAQYASQYATVISSTPVTASYPVQRQQCSEGSALVQQQPSGAGALIGAIAGGVLGHTVGAGFGRAAATGIGAVAGSVVGNSVEANSNPVTEVPTRRCQVVTAYENRVVGYDVTYEYAGQRYNARMARDPGRQFAVNVQPADSNAQTMPVPVYNSQPVPQAQSGQPAYYDPLPAQPVYYSQPVQPYYEPSYYPSPAVYVAPLVGFGLGYYVGGGGYRGGYRHWR